MTRENKIEQREKVKELLELAGMIMLTAGIGSTIVLVFFLLLHGNG